MCDETNNPESRRELAQRAVTWQEAMRPPTVCGSFEFPLDNQYFVPIFRNRLEEPHKFLRTNSRLIKSVNQFPVHTVSLDFQASQWRKKRRNLNSPHTTIETGNLFGNLSLHLQLNCRRIYPINVNLVSLCACVHACVDLLMKAKSQ